MSNSRSRWEVVIQDVDDYFEAVELVKKLRLQIDHENGHGEEDVEELEIHLAMIQDAINRWEYEQKVKQDEKEQQLLSAEEDLKLLEAKRLEMIRKRAPEAKIALVSVQINALRAVIEGKE